MNNAISDIKVTVVTAELLQALRANRAKHRQIVEEARTGYLEKAQEVLNKRMEQLRAGKIVNLYFALQLPIDHTGEYDTMIMAVEMHTGTSIELDASQVRVLIQDNWDWKGQFIGTNALYSKTAKDQEENE